MMLCFFNSNKEVCLVVDFYDTSFCPSRSVTPTPSKVSMDIHNIPSTLLYMRLAHQGTPSQSPPLRPLSSFSSIIVDEMN